MTKSRFEKKNLNSKAIQLLSSGQGVFETMLFESGVIWFLERHIERLKATLKLFNATADSINFKELLSDSLSDQNTSTALRVKLIILVPFDTTPKTIHDSDVLINMQTVEKGEDCQRYFKLQQKTWPFTDGYKISRIKTINYGNAFYQKFAANKEGFDDILYSKKSFLLETSVANIYAVRGTEIYTPSLDKRILPGIIRQLLLENIEITEKEIQTDELMTFDYCFVTNSIIEIRAVEQIDNHMFNVKTDHLNQLLNLWGRIKSKYLKQGHN